MGYEGLAESIVSALLERSSIKYPFVKRLFVGRCIIIAISFKNENRATAIAVAALLFCAAA